MADDQAGPIVTIFRNRLRADAEPQYGRTLARMQERVRAMPGFVEAKTFTADDGERVTIVLFDTLEHHRAWADDQPHVQAKELGRESFYEGYDLRVATTLRHSHWPT